MDNEQALRDVFNEALAKTSDGIIVHIPMPKYVTSLFFVALQDIARQAETAGCPFMVVVHPKLRVLMQMFQLDDTIPLAERLDQAMKQIRGEAEPDE